MASEDLIYYRGNRLFAKPFQITRDGVFFDISLLTSPTIRWWFKKKSKGIEVKKFIDWTGAPSGANNDIATFNVADKFFNECVKYESQLEVYDDALLLFHSEDIFKVEIKEPIGVHTDPIVA